MPISLLAAASCRRTALRLGARQPQRGPAAVPPRRRFLRSSRGSPLPCRASAEAEQLLTSGRAKYAAGDRMGALGLWEQALDQDPTTEQRLIALYNAACTHASFGDIELAQIPLKEAIFGGLDFPAALEQAASDSSGQYVRMQASAQVLIQLKRFSQQVVKARDKGTTAAAPPPAFRGGASSSSSSGGSGSGGGSRASGTGLLGADMSRALATDAPDIDASIGGIARRVALLLLGLVGLGAALFYGGLQYAFPPVGP